MNSNKNILDSLYKNKYFRAPSFLKEKKKQEITTLVLTLIALSFFGLFAISPTLSTIANLKKQLEDNEFVDRRLSEKINNLNMLQQKYNLMSQDLALITSTLPKKPDVPMFIAQLESIAISSKLNLNNFQTFQVDLFSLQYPKEYQIFAFSFNIKGSYPNIINFISTITDFERLIVIDSISLNKDPQEDLQANIRGRAYFKK